MRKFLLATILLGGIAAPVAAEMSREELMERTRTLQARAKPIRAAAVIEWVAGNCTDRLDPERVRRATEFLARSDEQLLVDFLRKSNDRQAQALRADNIDPCGAFIAELGN